MRGQQERTIGPLLACISTEERIPKAHSLRQVRRLADQALDRLNPSFCRLYPEGGRPSIPPEQLLLALLQQAIHVFRSERMLMEQLGCNLLRQNNENRDRQINEELMAKFPELLLAAHEVKPLLSSEHFSLDGTLLRAWASHSSLERIDGSDDEPPPPSGGKGFGGTAGKGYDTRDFVTDIRFAGITPHVAQDIQSRRHSAIGGRTIRHAGYAQSINATRRIEQVLGWIKQAAGLLQLRARGRSRARTVFRLHVVAYNLIHLANLLSPREAMA